MPVAINPSAAGTAGGAVIERYWRAVHTQRGVVPAVDRLSVANDIVADQRTTKSIWAGVGVATMYQLPIEK